jgi:hypothetical protein
LRPPFLKEAQTRVEQKQQRHNTCLDIIAEHELK